MAPSERRKPPKGGRRPLTAPPFLSNGLPAPGQVTRGHAGGCGQARRLQAAGRGVTAALTRASAGEASSQEQSPNPARGRHCASGAQATRRGVTPSAGLTGGDRSRDERGTHRPPTHSHSLTHTRRPRPRPRPHARSTAPGARQVGASPRLFPPHACRIRRARSLASSGKLGLSSRFG